MDQEEEEAYEYGRRLAFRRIVELVLRELGYDKDMSSIRWLVEREEAIARLREICAEHGDNEWEPSLNLADVLEKHLANHLARRPLTAALAHQRAERLFGVCERNWLRKPTVQDFRMILRRMAGLEGGDRA